MLGFVVSVSIHTAIHQSCGSFFSFTSSLSLELCGSFGLKSLVVLLYNTELGLGGSKYYFYYGSVGLIFP